MAEPARAFELPSKLPENKKDPQIPEAPEAPQEEKKKGLFLAFTRPDVEAKENVPESTKEGYEAYHALEGCLTQPEYEIVKKIGDTAGASVKKIYVMDAKKYAKNADDIKLSDEVLHLYAVLRDHFNNPAVPDKLAVLGDPQLLAEVLRMKGESAALKQLTTAPNLKHIFGKKN